MSMALPYQKIINKMPEGELGKICYMRLKPK